MEHQHCGRPAHSFLYICATNPVTHAAMRYLEFCTQCRLVVIDGKLSLALQIQLVGNFLVAVIDLLCGKGVTRCP